MKLNHLIWSILLLSLTITSCSKPKTQKRPNILIAISDDQSFAHTSLMGDPLIQTPNFDKLAKSGIHFTNCIAGSPGCAPSRSALLTGRYPWQNEQAGQHASDFPSKYVTFPLLLEKAGYKIGITGKGCDPFNWKGSGWKHNPAGPVFNKIVYKENSPDAPPAKGISRTNYAENFKQFLKERDTDQPFYFWYGAKEPHRFFEKYSGKKLGKDIEDALVPGFLPNDTEVQSDMADYAVEIEWFDKHLGEILKHLEEIGELDNTIVIVTSDNGMAFPRAKANGYEYGIHVPMAISWPEKIKANRTVNDLISFTDIAPTILALTHTGSEGMMPITGQNIEETLLSEQNGLTEHSKDFVFSSRERHSSSRWNNLGYPIRSMRTHDYLLVRNFKAERWPAGAPQMLKEDGSPDTMHGRIHPQKGMYDFSYTDIDPCPTKDVLIEKRDNPAISPYFEMAVGKRAEYELFNIKKDPYCINDLAQKEEYKEKLTELVTQMDDYLQATGDPRYTSNPDIFESYKRYSHIRSFPKADWAE